MANTVDKVIKIATQEVGYLEKKSNSNLDSKTANAGYNNYTKYGRDMHNIYPEIMDFPAAWCDCFVDWCFYKAYGIATAKSLLCGNFDDYTVASAKMYKNKNAYHKSNPKVGDQVFFKNASGICHTGLVYAVDTNYIYTIEGNTSGGSGVVSNGGGVFKKKYSKSYYKIDGYGRPKYDTTSTKPSSSTTKTQCPKNITNVKEVQQYLVYKGYNIGKCGIDGEYGKDTRNALCHHQLKNGGSNIIKKGSKGELARNVQMFLICKGYDIGKYGADGDIGTCTVNAIKNFQKNNKLVQDGIVGTKTWNKLMN